MVACTRLKTKMIFTLPAADFFFIPLNGCSPIIFYNRLHAASSRTFSSTTFLALWLPLLSVIKQWKYDWPYYFFMLWLFVLFCNLIQTVIRVSKGMSGDNNYRSPEAPEGPVRDFFSKPGQWTPSSSHHWRINWIIKLANKYGIYGRGGCPVRRFSFYVRSWEGKGIAFKFSLWLELFIFLSLFSDSLPGKAFFSLIIWNIKVIKIRKIALIFWHTFILYSFSLFYCE